MREPEGEEPVLTVDVVEAGAGSRLVVAGDLDLDGALVLDRAIEQLDPSSPVELDLSGVGFLDSSGLRSLLQHCDDRATIVGSSDAVTRTCELAAVTFLLDGSETSAG